MLLNVMETWIMPTEDDGGILQDREDGDCHVAGVLAVTAVAVAITAVALENTQNAPPEMVSLKKFPPYATMVVPPSAGPNSGAKLDTAMGSRYVKVLVPNATPLEISSSVTRTVSVPPDDEAGTKHDALLEEEETTALVFTSTLVDDDESLDSWFSTPLFSSTEENTHDI